jgi:CTP synthase (UTP-ammonia lyase)
MCHLQANNVTTGRIYLSVIEKEKRRVLENGSSCSSYHNEIKERMHCFK